MSARAFRDIWPLVMVFKLSNCTRSCNFENFKNITAAYITKCTRVHTIFYTNHELGLAKTAY